MKYLTIFLSALALLTACDEPLKRKELPAKVSVMEVRNQEFIKHKNYLGHVSSEHKTKYSFKIAGKVFKINKREGDSVQKGNIIAKLDKNDISRAVEESRLVFQVAEQNYGESKKYFEKVKIAYENKGISDADFEKLKVEHTSKENEFKRAALNYEQQKEFFEGAEIKSNYNGIISNVFVEQFEYVDAGSPIIEVTSNEKIVVCEIADKDHSSVINIQSAKVNHDENFYPLELKRIASSASEFTNSYKAELTFVQNPGMSFLDGEIVDVKINLGKKTGIWIPLSVIMSEGEDFVFIIENNRAVRRNIEIHDVINLKANVSGLMEKDIVVVQGMFNLRDGKLVNYNKKEEL